MHSERNVTAALVYVQGVIGLMGLGVFRLHIHSAYADEDSDAQVRLSGRRVEMWLGRSFFEAAPDEQRDTVIHEVLHLPWFPMKRVLDAHVRHALSKREKRALNELLAEEEHKIVETLSIVLAQVVPLPQFSVRKSRG